MRSARAYPPEGGVRRHSARHDSSAADLASRRWCVRLGTQPRTSLNAASRHCRPLGPGGPGQPRESRVILVRQGFFDFSATSSFESWFMSTGGNVGPSPKRPIASMAGMMNRLQSFVEDEAEDEEFEPSRPPVGRDIVATRLAKRMPGPDLDLNVTLVYANLWKNYGGYLFKEGQLAEARDAYLEALRACLRKGQDYELPGKMAYNADVGAIDIFVFCLALGCANNIAQCYLKEGNTPKVCFRVHLFVGSD